MASKEKPPIVMPTMAPTLRWSEFGFTDRTGRVELVGPRDEAGYVDSLSRVEIVGLWEEDRDVDALVRVKLVAL